jgi:hypothetical protein
MAENASQFTSWFVGLKETRGGLPGMAIGSDPEAGLEPLADSLSPIMLRGALSECGAALAQSLHDSS